jgi:hypothetical protein
MASGMSATFILLLAATIYLLVDSFDPWWFWVLFSIGLFLGILALILGVTGVD